MSWNVPDKTHRYIMYTIDLSLVIIIILVLLLYNSLMTALFLKQRFSSAKSTMKLNSVLSFCLVLIITFLVQFMSAFLREPSIVIIVYAFTITIWVVWDRIAKRNKKA